MLYFPAFLVLVDAKMSMTYVHSVSIMFHVLVYMNDKIPKVAVSADNEQQFSKMLQINLGFLEMIKKTTFV